MENPISATRNPPALPKNSPPVLTAAVATLVFSLLSIAALTGLLPNAMSEKSGEQIVARTTRSGSPPSRVAGAATCANGDTVESARAVEVKDQAGGVRAIAGGVTGAIVGNPFGRGNDNTALTILSAAGGTLAGNEIEKNIKKQITYRVTVRIDDGSYRTVSQSAQASPGDKVRIIDGALVLRS